MDGRGGRRGSWSARACGALLLGALAAALGAPLAHASVSVDDIVVDEGDGPVTATFTVTRSAALLAGAITVAYATADGTARAPADYLAASGSVSFAAQPLGGVQTQVVSITVQGDALDEADETFALGLSGAEVADGEGIATIVDDDPSPGVGVVDAPPAAEGGVAQFRIALGAPSGRDVAVSFATADGTAVAGRDYVARAGSAAIPAGSTSVTIGVALLDDDLDEPDETFELRIGSPVNAVVTRAAGVARIVDTDEPPAPAGGPPAPPAGPAVGAPAPPAATGSAAGPSLPRLGLSAPRLRRPWSMLVTLSCPRESGRCRGRVTIFSRPVRRSRIRALRSERRLGRRAFSLAGGTSRTLAMALSPRDRALLRRAGRMRVRAYAVTDDAAGRTGVRRVNGTLIGRTSHSG